MEQILEYSPILIQGTITTIELTLASVVLALIISFVVGLARFSSLRMVRVAAIVYLEFFRGTSAIVQMFFMFYVLPLFGGNLGLWPQFRKLWVGGCSQRRAVGQ